MIKLYYFFVLTFWLSCVKTAIADYSYPEVNQTINITHSLLAENEPNNWLDIGQLVLGTGSDLSDSLTPCSPSNFMCTAGSVSLGYNGQSSYTVNFLRKPTTIYDNAGNSIMFTVAFPTPPAIWLYERNVMGGRTWNNALSLNNNLTSPSDTNDGAYVSGKASGYCGAVSGCDYVMGAYIHNDSGMPSLYIKIPSKLSGDTISFNDLELLSLALNITDKNHDTVSPTSAKLYISGTISIPQRCYIKAEKNNFDFGTVYSNSNSDNGLLKSMSTTITTSCYYAPNNTEQHLKMEAVSGGVLNESSMAYMIGQDSALGIVFNINQSPLCDSITDKNVFNKEYLIRTISYQKELTEKDTLNFALCKYGVPSITGQKNVVLKLTSRWVVN
ncbi:hypothetical protein RCM34_24860 [Escherichia coli]|nr:hypothetical protein [Escherichia coli]